MWTHLRASPDTRDTLSPRISPKGANERRVLVDHPGSRSNAEDGINCRAAVPRSLRRPLKRRYAYLVHASSTLRGQVRNASRHVPLVRLLKRNIVGHVIPQSPSERRRGETDKGGDRIRKKINTSVEAERRKKPCGGLPLEMLTRWFVVSNYFDRLFKILRTIRCDLLYKTMLAIPVLKVYILILSFVKDELRDTRRILEGRVDIFCNKAFRNEALWRNRSYLRYINNKVGRERTILLSLQRFGESEIVAMCETDG
ncbi:hypothetical protein V1478_018655 [Vespula squamosa]|uniref:Uncharacterized protein n=1 Tax=Vespula squamosa TaxID=30214 RepID=A0ABD1ZTE0_VESSQ